MQDPNLTKADEAPVEDTGETSAFSFTSHPVEGGEASGRRAPIPAESREVIEVCGREVDAEHAHLFTDAERGAEWPVPSADPDPAYMARGYPHEAPIRDIVQGYGITPLSGKRPLRSGWQVDPDRSGLDWLAEGHQGNYGIVLRDTDHLLLVDVDVKGGRDGREAFTSLANTANLNAEPFLMQRTPSGGFHLLGRIPEGYPAGRLPNGAACPGLDVLRDRKQFVRAPGRTGSGEYREVRPLPPLEALPEWPVEFLDLLAGSGSSSTTDERPPEDLQAPSVDWVREAVRKIRNGAGFESRDAWQKMASAVKAAVGPAHEEEGLRIFSEFSARWEDGTNDPGVTERLYRTSPTGRVGWTWLAELSGTGIAEEVFEADPTLAVESATPPKPTGMLAKIRTAAELVAEPRLPVKYVVDGALARGRSSILAAPPKIGKSTLSRALAVAVAKGEEWCGFEVESGRVLYCALEEHRDDVADDLDSFGGALENLDVYAEALPPAEPGKALVEASKARGPYSLIVIDTLFRLFQVDDGNDYALTTQALPVVTHVAQETGAHVLGIHHTRKGLSYSGDPFEMILGSTGIWANFDAGMLYLPGKRLGETERMLTLAGRRHVTNDRRIIRQDSDGTLRHVGSYADVQAERLYGYLLQHGPQTYEELAAGLEWGENTVRKYMPFLEDLGRAEQQGEGIKGDPYRWAAIDTATAFEADAETAADLSDITDGENTDEE